MRQARNSSGRHGPLADFLEGRLRQYIYFVRAWSGFSVYKLRVEEHEVEYRVTEA